MSTPRRRSLRDREARAIAGPDDHQLAPESSTTEATVEPAAASTALPAAPKRPVTAGAGNTVRVGMYFHPHDFDAAKAGYLADWQHGGTADTFARWIAAAIEEHARRTPEQRAQMARPLERAETRGATRSFSLPASTVERMREAINADHQAGRWPTDSAWCGDAIAAAVGAARERGGGQLPTPPVRLPNRLVR